MARSASTLVVLGLLAGTAVAFVVAQRKKLEPSPIAGTRVREVISPLCRCPSGEAEISFRLRRADRVSLAVLDDDGELVRTLERGVRVERGRFDTRWDGRDELGRIVPEGSYRLRIRLARAGRRIVVPNRIAIDTTPPTITLGDVRPRAFSPDGDGRNERIELRYTLSEAGRPLLYVDGERQSRGRLREALAGKLDWFGRRDGDPLPPGLYGVSLAAEDVAGNVSTRTRPTPVRVRYIELGVARIRTRTRRRFSVQVVTDARRYRWRFAGGRGTAERTALRLRAPRRPGRYRLFVEANGHGASARVIVTRPAPRSAPPRAGTRRRGRPAARRGTRSGTPARGR